MANEKNYLGMGIIFEGIDKGLVKQLRTVQKEAAASRAALDSIYNNKNLDKFSNKTKKSLSEVEKSMASLDKTVDELGKSFSDLHAQQSKPQKDNTKEQTGRLDKLKGVLSQVAATYGVTAASAGLLSKVIKGNQEYKETTKQFDALGAKMRTVFDADAVRDFQKANVSNMTSMGVTADEANRMATSITQFSTGIQSATNALPFMGKLVGQMGLEAGFVGEMFGKSMAALNTGPKSIMDMTAQFFTLGKSFGQVDFIQNLPTVFENATENAMRFGKITEQEVNASVMSTTKLGLAFTKMGVSQKEAISRATGFADKLADMRESIFDLQAGLDPADDRVFQFASTLAQFGGFSMEDAISRLMSGGPDEIVKMISDIGASLDEQTRKTFQQLAKRQVGSEVVNLAIAQRDNLNAAVDTASATNLSASNASEQLNRATQENTNTFEYQTKLIKANTDALEINARVMNERASDALKSALKGEADAYQNLNKMVSDNNSLMGQAYILADLTATGGAAAIAAFAGAGQDAVNKMQMFATSIDTVNASAKNLASSLPMADLFGKLGELAGLAGAGAAAIGGGKLLKGIFGKKGPPGGSGGAGKAAGRAAGEVGEEVLKSGTKAGIKSAGKMAKMLPFVGNLISAGFAAKDAYDIASKIYNGEKVEFSDIAALGLSAAGAIPGVGNAVSMIAAGASLAIDAGGDKYLNSAASAVGEKIKSAMPSMDSVPSLAKDRLPSLMTTADQFDEFIKRQGLIPQASIPINDMMDAQEFVKSEEGLRLETYKDIAGHKTIGYGHKLLPGENLTQIDQKKADELFQKDFNNAMSIVQERTKGIELQNNQLAALTSLVFNIGPAAIGENTNLMKSMRAGDMEAAAKEFDHFYFTNESGQKEINAGLMNRRVKEASMFAGRQMSLSDLLDKQPKFIANNRPNLKLVPPSPDTKSSPVAQAAKAQDPSKGQRIIKIASEYNKNKDLSAYEQAFLKINPSLAPGYNDPVQAQVINNQQTAASAQTSAPTTEAASVQTSGFDVGAAISNLTSEVANLRGAIQTMASSLNVNVSLLGDARKIFEVVKNEDLSQNAIRSSSAAIARGG